MTVFEMQGVLRGKAIPGDMKVNESLAEYLVRKLADAEAIGVEKAADYMQTSGAQSFGDCYIALVNFAAALRNGEAV